MTSTMTRALALMLMAWLVLAPVRVLACACGCGMFSVGMPGLGLPTASGLAINLQTTVLDQDEAMRGSAKIPLSASPDKRIRTLFYNLNLQYQINRSWGLMAMVPYWSRSFDSDANFGTSPARLAHSHIDTLSDVRIEGIYSGLSEDMSTGLIFGLKLPTGTYTASGFDRDTEPGSGTTDVLLGGYQWGNLAPNWSWFAQGMVRSALGPRAGYRPGDSLQVVAGIHYDGLRFRDHVAPMLQIHYTHRRPDSGIHANPANSGLSNAFVTPGILFDLGRHWMANANLYLPVYQHVTGVQLVPRQVFSFGITYNL